MKKNSLRRAGLAAGSLVSVCIVVIYMTVWQTDPAEVMRPEHAIASAGTTKLIKPLDATVEQNVVVIDSRLVQMYSKRHLAISTRMLASARPEEISRPTNLRDLPAWPSAALAGDTNAAIKMAVLSRDGGATDLVSQAVKNADISETQKKQAMSDAWFWWKAAAATGDIPSRMTLATALSTAVPIQSADRGASHPNMLEARKLVESLAAEGVVEAMDTLAHWHSSGRLEQRDMLQSNAYMLAYAALTHEVSTEEAQKLYVESLRACDRDEVIRRAEKIIATAERKR